MSVKNKMTKRWATFPTFTDKELVGLASRGPNVCDRSVEDCGELLNSGRFVVCWDGAEKPEHADLKLGTLCGVTLCNFGRMEIVVRLENGETFRCGNAVLIDPDLLPYVVGGRKHGTLEGCEAIGRLVGFVENYEGTVYGYLRSVNSGSILAMNKDCLAYSSDIKFGL